MFHDDINSIYITNSKFSQSVYYAFLIRLLCIFNHKSTKLGEITLECYNWIIQPLKEFYQRGSYYCGPLI